MPIDIPATLDRLNYRYPSFLVDAVVDHEPGQRIVGMKNVTVNEEFFQGHFPGTPLKIQKLNLLIRDFDYKF